MSGHRTTRPRAPLSRELLLRLAPVIEHEVRRYLRDAPIDRSAPGRAAIEHALNSLFGTECTTDERRTFFVFAAPLARRAVIDSVVARDAVVHRALFAGTSSMGSAGGSAHFLDAQTVRTVIDRPFLLKHWLARLESFDPHCVLMVDLHYFCGWSVRATALALGWSVPVVLRDLRFAKRWLQAYARSWKGEGRSL